MVPCQDMLAGKNSRVFHSHEKGTIIAICPDMEPEEMMTYPLRNRNKIQILVTRPGNQNGHDETTKEMTLKWRSEHELFAIVITMEGGPEHCYYRHPCSHRLLFFRQLEISGCRERIEMRINETVSGEIRINETPFYFDDWTLKFMFKEFV